MRSTGEPKLTMSSNNKNNSQSNSEFDTGIGLADEYLETTCGAEISKSTATTYSSKYRKLGRFLSDTDKSAMTIVCSDIKEYLRNQTKEGLAHDTLLLELVAIRSIYRFARLEKTIEPEIDVYALQNLSIRNWDTRKTPDPKPLEKEGLQRLIEGAKNRRNRLMIFVGGEVGARNGSLRNIKLEKVDLVEDEIELENLKEGGYYSIPISEKLALELERWIEVEREDYITDVHNPYLFPSNKSGHLLESFTFWEIVHHAAKRADLQEIRYERELTSAEKEAGIWNADTKKFWRVSPHTLRRTFSHILWDSGLSSKVRRDALDHESIETTEEHYTFDNEDYKDLIRELRNSD